MIAVAWFQAILSGLGWLLARLYDVVPNYGVAIIIFTLGIRLLLLPIGVRQFRSMQATAVMQPKMKALQQKYKNDRQRLYEETQKLYREYGYNPLSGCLPLLAQLPVLICLFAVLQFPKGLTHIPTDSKLHYAISHQNTDFLGANLICSAVESGHQVPQKPVPGLPSLKSKDCGSGFPAHIPYYAFAVVMIGATYYQQRQIQKTSPVTQNPQQQTIMRIMPLMFGVYGFIFPAGLVLYWSTTTLVQIGQQYVLIRRRGVAPTTPKEDARGDGAGARGAKGRPNDRGPRGGAGRSGRQGRSEPKRGTTRGAAGRSGTPGRVSGGRSSGGKATGGKAGGASPRTSGSSFGGRRGGVSGTGGLRSGGGGFGKGGGDGDGRRSGPKPDGNGGTSGRQPGGSTGGSGARDARDRKKRPDR
jgi:YidC/Oxa1 family membrane protein insertase